MMLLERLRQSLERRRAKRRFREYPAIRRDVELPVDGRVEFADWTNPIVTPKTITQDEVDFFREFIPAGSLAIDIGAHIGDTAVPMALAATSAGLILAFDPNPQVFAILESNARLNPARTRIDAYPFAITDADADFFYASSEASFSNGGISAERDGRHGSHVLPQRVRGVNLERFLESRYAEWIPRLSCIKIDAEGHDVRIIRSIRSVLMRYGPALLSECFSKLSASERGDLYDAVADAGYQLFRVDRFARDTPRTALRREDMMARRHFDFLALPSNRVASGPRAARGASGLAP